jgi:hypothetical protein
LGAELVAEGAFRNAHARPGVGDGGDRLYAYPTDSPRTVLLQIDLEECFELVEGDAVLTVVEIDVVGIRDDDEFSVIGCRRVDVLGVIA